LGGSSVEAVSGRSSPRVKIGVPSSALEEQFRDSSKAASLRALVEILLGVIWKSEMFSFGELAVSYLFFFPFPLAFFFLALTIAV